MPGENNLSGRRMAAGGKNIMGTSTTSVEARNKALVRDSFEAWTQGTGGPFDLLTDDASWTIEGNSLLSKTYAGREAFMREVIGPFNARMSVGLKPAIREICADGDIVVIFFDGKATARDGKPYANTYFWLFEMHDGKVTRASAMFDSVELNDFWTRVSPAQP
jgi:ketosteroid isomerase-like protein